MTWRPTPLPDHLTSRGGDPALVGKELVHIITEAIANHPRSLQKVIGPSEVGHPCARRIGYKLLGAPDLNPNQGVPWKPFIGTAVHEKNESIFDRWNLDHDTGHGQERWLLEHRVNVGEIGGVEVWGSADVYDRVTATVIDWKIVGPAPLKDYKRKGPGPQYRSQAHLYGRGFVRAGLPVDTVMVVFLPRNDELDKAHIWHEPYSEQVALDALQRANGIHATTAALGPQALPVLPTADAYCYRCPFYRHGSIDLVQGCPGDDASRVAPQPALTMAGGPA